MIEYDFCPHLEYLVAVSHKVKSFQITDSSATGSLFHTYSTYKTVTSQPPERDHVIKKI